MADKTRHDILEVSPGAPSEVVLAAYERLAAKYDPENPQTAAVPTTTPPPQAAQQPHCRLFVTEHTGTWAGH